MAGRLDTADLAGGPGAMKVTFLPSLASAFPVGWRHLACDTRFMSPLAWSAARYDGLAWAAPALKGSTAAHSSGRLLLRGQLGGSGTIGLTVRGF